MTAAKVMSEITKVLQSNENIPLDQLFIIDVVAIKSLTGSGKNSTSLKVLDYSKDGIVKKSIITIKNKDALCCVVLWSSYSRRPGPRRQSYKIKTV